MAVSDRWDHRKRKNRGCDVKISRALAAVADLPIIGGARGERREGGAEMGKRRLASAPAGEEMISFVNNLDDGCLMHIFSFLSPIPGSIRS